MWGRLCNTIGRPELEHDPELNPDRARYRLFRSVIKPILEEWAQDKTRDEVVSAFLSADLPIGPVQNARDLLECPHLKARNMMIDFDDPNAGHLKFTGNPFKFSAIPEGIPRPAPLVGQDTDDVLRTLLGIEEGELTQLRKDEVI